MLYTIQDKPILLIRSGFRVYKNIESTNTPNPRPKPKNPPHQYRNLSDTFCPLSSPFSWFWISSPNSTNCMRQQPDGSIDLGLNFDNQIPFPSFVVVHHRQSAMAFGIGIWLWHLAFGVWHLAFGIWLLALALAVACIATSISEDVTMKR